MSNLNSGAPRVPVSIDALYERSPYLNVMAHTQSLSQFVSPIALTALLAGSVLLEAQWTLDREANPEGPGERLGIRHNGDLAAAWIFGEGQFKPYLHVYGSGDLRLTNSGMDTEGNKSGTFGHHRGIFIGWNRITSEHGRSDLWHMTKGTSMEIIRFQTLFTTDHHATTEAVIHWRAGKSADLGADLLVEEHRRITVSEIDAHTTQIDFATQLTAARDLTLGGDLQHAGVHFRASNEVAGRRKETAHFWSPAHPGTGGRIVADDWQWATQVFPVGERWFYVTEMTAPGNGFTELSRRDYGRFGFFQPKELEKDAELHLHFRFVVGEIDGLDQPHLSNDLRAQLTESNQEHYAAFVKSLATD